jgi:hypothetical protein
MKKTVMILALILLSAAAAAQVSFSDLVQVVPGPGLPPQVQCQRSNNNLDLARFEGRLFLGFRTAPTHFAGTKTRLYIVSSRDEGQTWEYEAEVFLGSDMREPRFLALSGRSKLMFYFFQAGKNPLAFAPQSIYAMERKAGGGWTEPERIYEPGCVLWRAKERAGRAYITVYCGGEGEYTGGNADITIRFLTTEDGYELTPVNPERAVIAGGGSETDFEFDEDGVLYGVIRNEAGDGESWGSKVCRAPATDPSDWSCKVTPFKYDSPLMFRHGPDIYLLARRNLDGEYDKGSRWLWDPVETLYYLARYWWTPKRTALYHLDKQNLVFTPILDFPSRGDTAFPALVPQNEHQYLMLNYSSPPEGKDRVWMSGQLHETNIYATVITFE